MYRSLRVLLTFSETSIEDGTPGSSTRVALPAVSAIGGGFLGRPGQERTGRWVVVHDGSAAVAREDFGSTPCARLLERNA
jgi:hypothetical protein